MAKRKSRSSFSSKKLPQIVKNKFFLTALLFLIWILFFDKHSVITQFKLERALNDLEQQEEYYTEEIEIVKAEQEALFTNQENLEKYARERYYFKKSNEDVFVIMDK